MLVKSTAHRHGSLFVSEVKALLALQTPAVLPLRRGRKHGGAGTRNYRKTLRAEHAQSVRQLEKQCVRIVQCLLELEVDYTLIHAACELWISAGNPFPWFGEMHHPRLQSGRALASDN